MVDVKGNLYFKNLKDLSSKGLIANYNNDRIVFYQGVHSYDFVGYFIRECDRLKLNTINSLDIQPWSRTTARLPLLALMTRSLPE